MWQRRIVSPAQSIAAAGSVCESISATKKVPATYVARTSHFFSTRRWPGERHEMIAAPELLDYASGDALIGDTGYDSNEFRAELKARGIKAVISSKPERKRKIPKNRALYRKRYLVEVFFHNLKRFRGIATRFDKTRASYLAFVHIGCICLWLN